MVSASAVSVSVVESVEGVTMQEQALLNLLGGYVPACPGGAGTALFGSGTTVWTVTVTLAGVVVSVFVVVLDGLLVSFEGPSLLRYPHK